MFTVHFVALLARSNCILTRLRVGNKHCRITWDGKEDKGSAVTVLDISSNGTWVSAIAVV